MAGHSMLSILMTFIQESLNSVYKLRENWRYLYQWLMVWVFLWEIFSPEWKNKKYFNLMGSGVFSWENLTWNNIEWWEVYHPMCNFWSEQHIPDNQGNYGCQQFYLIFYRLKKMISFFTIISFPHSDRDKVKYTWIFF